MVAWNVQNVIINLISTFFISMSNSENKYWRGIEELEANPATLENISNEFSDKLPMEEILGDTEELSSNRRDFLKI